MYVQYLCSCTCSHISLYQYLRKCTRKKILKKDDICNIFPNVTIHSLPPACAVRNNQNHLRK
ncbi:hypothetical protein BRYFOR_05489 [Marvinbryantia formatexigens DSM 14469]|uniref:Uncharacterized protein n=1 Tax=Marvinbryantia formatexigens DSM 14469 TaxID=478749 RepID=C6LA47_9FIRM|nr:hypothetical protein BRYFOR_05489 [Marvinbryantia formatexigens DSM 14469]